MTTDASGRTDGADAAGPADEPSAPAPGGRLQAVRSDPRRRTAALIAAALVGLVAASLHWSGLVLAGAVIGLVSRSLPRAVGAAVAFGAAVLFVFALTLGDDLGRAVEMAPVVYVTAAAALGLPAVGSLVRGIV